MSEGLISIEVEKEVEKLPEGVWLATSEELPGLLVQADMLTETLEVA